MSQLMNSNNGNSGNNKENTNQERKIQWEKKEQLKMWASELVRLYNVELSIHLNSISCKYSISCPKFNTKALTYNIEIHFLYNLFCLVIPAPSKVIAQHNMLNFLETFLYCHFQLMFYWDGLWESPFDFFCMSFIIINWCKQHRSQSWYLSLDSLLSCSHFCLVFIITIFTLQESCPFWLT